MAWFPTARARSPSSGWITTAQTVYTNIARTAGTLRFDNTNTYVISGAGSLTIEADTGNGSIEVLNGSHKINLPTFFASNSSISVATGAMLDAGEPDYDPRTRPSPRAATC